LAAARKRLEESQRATASAQAQHEAAAQALEAERARAAGLQAELEQQAKRSAAELDKLKSRLATADTALSESARLASARKWERWTVPSHHANARAQTWVGPRAA